MGIIFHHHLRHPKIQIIEKKALPDFFLKVTISRTRGSKTGMMDCPYIPAFLVHRCGLLPFLLFLPSYQPAK